MADRELRKSGEFSLPEDVLVGKTNKRSSSRKSANSTTSSASGKPTKSSVPVVQIYESGVQSDRVQDV